MRYITLAILIVLISNCGVKHSHNASGKVYSENSGELVVDITSSVCTREDFTPEQVLRCLELLTEVRAEIAIEAEEQITDIVNTIVSEGE